MPTDTGSPRADAEADFLRARRKQRLATLGGRLRGRDRETLALDEVIAAVGTRGERSLGLQMIPLEKIVGSVDRARDFDPDFLPTSGRSRSRWERLAEGVRRGADLPPIDVYQVGERYFVRDGHHRVSVKRALGDTLIEADVTKILTKIDPGDVVDRADLRARELRRIFLERIPLDRLAQREVECTDPWTYPALAEMVEAWAARLMFRDGAALSAAEASTRWYAEEFTPVTEMILGADLAMPGETPADAYLRIAHDRYSLVRAHIWTDEVFDQLKEVHRARPSTTPIERPRA